MPDEGARPVKDLLMRGDQVIRTKIALNSVIGSDDRGLVRSIRQTEVPFEIVFQIEPDPFIIILNIHRYLRFRIELYLLGASFAPLPRNCPNRAPVNLCSNRILLPLPYVSKAP